MLYLENVYNKVPLSTGPTLKPFQGETGESSKRWGGVHMGFPLHINATLNRTEPSRHVTDGTDFPASNLALTKGF